MLGHFSIRLSRTDVRRRPPAFGTERSTPEPQYLSLGQNPCFPGEVSQLFKCFLPRPTRPALLFSKTSSTRCTVWELRTGNPGFCPCLPLCPRHIWDCGCHGMNVSPQFVSPHVFPFHFYEPLTQCCFVDWFDEIGGCSFFRHVCGTLPCSALFGNVFLGSSMFARVWRCLAC